MSAVTQRAAPIRAPLDPQEFLSHLQTVVRASEATVKAYAADVRQFLAWLSATTGGAGPEHLTRQTLFRYMSSLQGLGPNSVRRKIHAIGSWCRFLVECGVIPNNPAQRLPLPRREQKVPRYPSSEQIVDLLAACRTRLERSALCLLATTGVRRAELLGLDLADLDLENGDIRVFGKCRKERVVPLPYQTVQVLRDYLESRGTAPGPLLKNRAGNRLGITSLRRLLTRLAKRAGIESTNPHAFRHSYCSGLIRNGVDIGTVRDLAGHGCVSVTGNYVHSDGLSRRSAVQRLPVLTAIDAHAGQVHAGEAVPSMGLEGGAHDE